MPNTLAHIGISTPLTRLFIKPSDTKWILAGTILPDIPWITQRILTRLFTGIDLYDLRIFSIIQATLFFSILLSAALSFFSSNVFRTFSILSFGSIIHLISDALEIKWANGVHFLAPFDWTITNFGLFWPESIAVYSLTIIGFIIFLFQLKDFKRGIQIKSPGKNLYIIISFLTAYFALPFLFFNPVINANNHYIKTLSDDARSGQYIELDRSYFVNHEKGDYIRTFTDEKLYPDNIDLPLSGLISIKAKFVTNNLLRVQDYYLHDGKIRDKLSMAGLALVGLYWSILFVNGIRNRKTETLNKN